MREKTIIQHRLLAGRLYSQALFVAGAFLISRLLCSVFVYIGHLKRPYLEPVPGGWSGVHNWWLNPWTTYDSEWYLQIATQGYQMHTTTFFPLYPWLLGLFAPDPVSMALAGVLISNISLFVALLLIYRLTTLEWDETIARATVWIVALMPTAPYFGAVYTESLFMAVLAATFLAVRNGHWWLAGVLGGVAALLRNPGFLIAGALLLEAGDKSTPGKSPAKWLACSIPLLVFIAVQASFWNTFHDPLAGVTSHTIYHRQWDWPWVPLFGDFMTLASGPDNIAFYIVVISSLIFTLTGLIFPIVGFKKIRSSYLLLVAGITLMNLAYARQILPHTISSPRFLSVLFPVSQLAALLLVRNMSCNTRKIIFMMATVIFVFYSVLFGLKSFLG